jgi:lipopolysaccharide cholinephosphotransferase
MLDQVTNNKLRARFNPDGSELRNIQLRELEILKYIDRVCKKYNINYWLSSGTLLEAVRHGGFIPWDDDVDVEMLRDDYHKFEKAMEKEKSKDFALQTHKTDQNYYSPYGKVRDLHSLMKEYNTKYDQYYKFQGLYVDIFILVPSSSTFFTRVGGHLQGHWLNFMYGFIKKPFLRKIYMNSIYSILDKVVYPFLRFILKIGSKDCLRQTPGSGFPKPRYKKEIFPLSTMQFEGQSFPVPNNCDSYLSHIYGDFTSLPDLDKLSKHSSQVIIN